MRFEFPFPYCGDAELGMDIVGALRRVVDPEMAIDIVDLGLVYGVEARDGTVRIRMTMTSAACPVADLIVDDIAIELERALGSSTEVQIEMCWEPPWAPERMSERARRALAT